MDTKITHTSKIKRQIVEEFTKRSVLVTPGILQIFAKPDIDAIQVLTQLTKQLDDNPSLREDPQQLLQSIILKLNTSSAITHITFNYNKEGGKREMQDFVKLFNNRYKTLSRMLQNRQELQSVLSIRRIIPKKEKEQVSFIGMINSITESRCGNLVVTLEDQTGEITALVNKDKTELYHQVKESVPDEVVGVVGNCSDEGGFVYCSNMIWPDVPITHELKKAQEEVYAVFISDIHVGSNNFLEPEFLRFIGWLSGKVGNEKQRKIASKVRYLFVVGDLIDGVGIYPGQENDLTISDAKEQYEACARYLALVPDHVQIIACAGNHDALRIAEPQPPFYRDYASSLYSLPNVQIVSNPAIVNIQSSVNMQPSQAAQSSQGFPGFNVLMYHGFSFDYYANNVDSLRAVGGYNRADLIMKYLLKRRHLAPCHRSTLYVPDEEIDPLVISTIPDFFVTGHIHYSIAANYRNITLISCSCWQSKTEYQEKLGHNPQPARVPVVNLQTRELKMMRFGAE